jgi:hypothetical protein
MTKSPDITNEVILNVKIEDLSYSGSYLKDALSGLRLVNHFGGRNSFVALF